MKNEYKKNIEIEYTNVDRNLKLNIVQAVDLIQNIMTQFFKSINSDNIVVREKNNAAWVVTKLIINFKKYPLWNEKVILTSSITSKSSIRLELETKAINDKGEILFVAKQETCPIDLDTRKIRKIETITFPNDIEIETIKSQNPYHKINYVFEENDKIAEREIYAIDTDYTHHTNNVKYIKFIANTLSSDFLDNNEITDLEVHYINESKEGDILEIYKHKKDGEVCFLIKKDEKEIIRAILKYKQL